MFIKNRIGLCISTLIILSIFILPTFAINDNSTNLSKDVSEIVGLSTKFPEEKKGYIYINESEILTNKTPINESIITPKPLESVSDTSK